MNSANAKSVTVTAKWTSNCNDGLSSVGSYKNFDYTGNVQTFNACAGRTYKLEVWGAQGGSFSGKGYGGHGGYAYGNITPSNSITYYVYVGGMGNNGYGGEIRGGWNGGGGLGNAYGTSSYTYGTAGGATDISTISSSMSYSNYRYVRSSASYNSRIIVAGGGGGFAVGWGSTYGGNGGGMYGESGLSGTNHHANSSNIATQTSAGLTTKGNVELSTFIAGFGYGVSSVQCSVSCAVGFGGGGWYGGGGPTGGYDEAGAGGSGYIGDPSLTNKGMYQYSGGAGNCTTSTATSTKTTCTVNSSSTATANYAKQGNGYARITRQS